MACQLYIHKIDIIVNMYNTLMLMANCIRSRAARRILIQIPSSWVCIIGSENIDTTWTLTRLAWMSKARSNTVKRKHHSIEEYKYRHQRLQIVHRVSNTMQFLHESAQVRPCPLHDMPAAAAAACSTVSKWWYRSPSVLQSAFFSRAQWSSPSISWFVF